jgi:hypothetical protein
MICPFVGQSGLKSANWRDCGGSACKRDERSWMGVWSEREDEFFFLSSREVYQGDRGLSQTFLMIDIVR